MKKTCIECQLTFEGANRSVRCKPCQLAVREIAKMEWNADPRKILKQQLERDQDTPLYERDHFPEHDCSVPDCTNRTTRRFLCERCYTEGPPEKEVDDQEDHGDVPWFIDMQGKLHTLEIKTKQRLASKVTVFHSGDHTQEELRAMVPSESDDYGKKGF